jgi:site-specific recombinase XerD
MKRTVKSKARRTKYNKANTTKVSVVKVLTPSQIEMIDSIDNDRDRSICQILLDTGLRVDELANLNYIDVYSDIRRNQVLDVITLVGKGNKERQVPLTDRAKAAIKAIHRYNKKELGTKIDKHCPLLISRNLNRLHTNTIRLMIQTELASNPHVFRHTCFTNLRKAGVRLEVIQKIAGHSSISTTEKYYLSVNTEDLKDAVRASTTLDAIANTVSNTKLRIA